ncbi:hypothetical protein GIB67_002395 [Kingdonia uniflora]|uniref:Uncharacterized protein n=1 Tax=Kingdonia uniflora TaxID=39325 RepID=A0A7J7M8E2_9MAGN|nr:hypothetical protein GIB67_002395 [Kingdonia uniflora]
MVTSSTRRALWVDIEIIAALNLPLLSIRDFNCIRNWDERSGGTGPLPCSISKFNDCIDSCRLIKSLSTGPKFSWCNGQKGKARILRRFDRVLYNSAWIQKCDGWSSKYMTRENSDHSAMVGCIQNLPKPYNIPFRFLKGWVTINTFEDMVIQSWGERLTDHLMKEASSKTVSLNGFSILKIPSGGRKPKLPGLLVGSVMQDPWVTFLRAKFFTRGGLLIDYSKPSSIWNGLKEAIAAVQANSKLIIRSGRDIDFWRDCWGSEVALIDLLNIPPEIWKHCTSKLS